MYVYESELIHHGVKGMKWGVRRYENPDGSLTAEGKKHVKTYKQYNKMKESKKSIDAVVKIAGYSGGPINEGYLRSQRKRTDALNSFTKSNKSGIKKGRKLAAKQGYAPAVREHYENKSNKQKLKAIGAGVAGGLLLRKAIKMNGLKTMWDVAGDVQMSTIHRNKRNRKLAASIIAASSAITLAALSKRNRKKADEYRKREA